MALLQKHRLGCTRWLIHVFYRQGVQGILDGASKGQLESEFGTSKDDDVMAQILEKGEIIETEVRLILPFSPRKTHTYILYHRTRTAMATGTPPRVPPSLTRKITTGQGEEEH